ncbi:hypothetical protein AV530_010540 [Patagioenas fasciata monilis]|uniref:Uncharacterized protein n=1 Tax=Patagioenas fasciata monilis TaxID=372326 RepID=A0A1V4KF82_PATFA|nr:hypothetical protein AV530_010540 [Patagioenas fasciata monilis]
MFTASSLCQYTFMDESRAISMTLSNPDRSSENHGLLYATFVPGSSFTGMPERGDRDWLNASEACMSI